MSARAFAGQIAANMNESASAPAHFSANGGRVDAPSYRVVWNFAPPQQSMAPNAICRGENVKSDEVGGSIDAYAAFCRHNEALSSVRGRIYHADTQNSLEFLHLVDAMMEQLFPTDVSGPRRSGDSRLGNRMSHPF
jgi:hypothetical protein